MKISWILAFLGALGLIILLVLLELGVLKSPWASVRNTPLPTSPISAAAASLPLPATNPPGLGLSASSSGSLSPQMVYKLTQQGLVAKEALAHIVKSPLPHFQNTENPHSVGTYKYREELALRVSALEALDQLTIKNPAEIQKLLEEIAKIQQDPTLQFLVRISLDGVYSKRPGKLSRAMNEMIAEKNLK